MNTRNPEMPDDPITALGGPSGFFEDFIVGRRMRHSRSATVTDIENNQLSKQMMNTAHAHWNDHWAPSGRLVFGLVTASMVLGLASQDTAAHALAELEIDDFRFLAPVRQGDTLTAFSEVSDRTPAPDRTDAGQVRFQHYGTNQHGTLVFRGCRTLLVKRRSHWA